MKRVVSILAPALAVLTVRCSGNRQSNYTGLQYAILLRKLIFAQVISMAKGELKIMSQYLNCLAWKESPYVVPNTGPKAVNAATASHAVKGLPSFTSFKSARASYPAYRCSSDTYLYERQHKQANGQYRLGDIASITAGGVPYNVPMKRSRRDPHIGASGLAVSYGRNRCLESGRLSQAT